MRPLMQDGNQEEQILDFSKKEVVDEAIKTVAEDTQKVNEEIKTEDKPQEQPVVENKESSLSPTTSVEQPKQEAQPSINDELALKYLSEKLGIEAKDLNDLKPKEDPLSKDPLLKELYEWRSKTNRPLEDWLNYQKDWSKESDINVAREFLKHEYPTLDSSEIELELQKFKVSDEDYDEDANKVKALELKKYATKGRATLEQLKSNYSAPVDNLTPEVKQNLELLDNIKKQYEQQEAMTKQYAETITKTAELTESVPIKLSNNLVIDFKLTPEERKQLPSLINTMPHWVNQDGSYNHKAIVEDGARIAHFDKIIKLAYEQGLNAGREDVVKSANNITLDRNRVDSNIPNSGTGTVIEGLDDYLGQRGMKVQFGNK